MYLVLTVSIGSFNGVVITLRCTGCRRGSVTHLERAIGETIPTFTTDFVGANRAIAKSRGGQGGARANSRVGHLVKVTFPSPHTTFIGVFGG